MSRSRYRSDRGLIARMGLTMFLLGLLFVVLGAVLIAAFHSYWVLVFLGGFLAVQWYFSDRLALYGMGGRIVTPEEAPELHGIVDRLCAVADMPKPKVAIADTDMPNAFATGRSQDHAVVCATRKPATRTSPKPLK
jgi:heat shock protein HtpX